MRLLFGAMAGLIVGLPAIAQVDPKIAEMCMKAQDFSGCVQTMTGGGTATTDEVQKLRSVMKQVAARLDNGISYRDSTNLFQPLVDQLAMLKGNENELAVKSLLLPRPCSTSCKSLGIIQLDMMGLLWG